MRIPLKSTVLAAVATFGLAGCSLLSGDFGDVPAATRVDVARYMGDWRVIANIPYFGEEGCVDSVESYALRPDGRIDNWFSCRKGSQDAPFEHVASAVADVVNGDSGAEWVVAFYPFLKIKYVVLAVDPQYQWAAVAHPSREYGWVFARGTSLPEETYQHILMQFRQAGYDSTRFVKVPQPTPVLQHPRP
ncbi:MAG: hypothetical protein RL026_2585 [Pseudomonadota bacterium]|jgi:apolipoprotein D and lipocalin family protein